MALVTSLNRSVQAPFWKMDLSDNEIAVLKDTIKKAADAGRLHEHPIEAALLYSEWWRNEYVGGFPSKERVAEYAGLDARHSEDLFKSARKALRVCGIQVTRIEAEDGRSSNRYFSTLLLQGGLPMRSMLDGKNFGSYTKFLTDLADSLAGMIPDWENPALVESLGCAGYLPRAFRNSTIYQLGLDIVHAIIEDKEYLLPYDTSLTALKELTDEIHNTYTARVRTLGSSRPLTISWELSIDEQNGKASMEYHLDNNKSLTEDKVAGLGEGVYQFSVKVSGQKAASFRRGRDGYSRIGSGDVRIPWKGESFVDVIAVGPDHRTAPLEVIDNCPPDFSMPQVFVNGGSRWYLRHNIPIVNDCVVLYDRAVWECEGIEATDISLAGITLGCVHLNGQAVFVSRLTDERKTMTSRYSDYRVAYVNENISWLDSASCHVVTGCPNYIVYDKEMQPLRERCPLSYRRRGTNEWTRARRNTNLPTGRLDLKVEFPDGTSREDSVYCIGDFSPQVIKSGSEEVQMDIHCSWGDVLPQEVAGIGVSRSGDTVTLSHARGETVFPSALPFRIIGREGIGDLTFHYPTPFTVFCLYDRIEGKVISNGGEIAYGNIGEYDIIQRNQLSPYASFMSPEANAEMRTVNRVPLHDTVTPLADFSDIIEGLFALYGAGENFGHQVILNLGDSRVIIRRFDQQLVRNEAGVLELTAGGDPSSLLCCSMSLTDFGVISVDQFTENCDPTNDESSAFLVFSPKDERCRTAPRTLGRQRTVDEWIDELTKRAIFLKQTYMNDPAWAECCSAFSTAVENDLPFRCFNCLKAVAADPFLLARFHVAMWYSNMTDILMANIFSFEQENAVCIHWIKQEHWWKAIDDLTPLLTSGLLNNSSYVSVMEMIYHSLVNTSGESILPVVAANETTFRERVFINPADIQQIRADIQGMTDGNEDMPSFRIDLAGHMRGGRYYGPNTGMNGYQKTFMHAALKVYECHKGLCGELFNEPKDLRRVMCFYAHRCHNPYNSLLKMTIKD